MQRNVWHRTLCGASVQQWTEDVLPTDADCAACADAPQPAQPDAAALRAVLAAHWFKPVDTTVQRQVCWCGWCPDPPVTVMSSGAAWIEHVIAELAARAAAGGGQ